MSERNHAPRPGGRAAEPRRATGRRDTVESRDADAQRSAARGARHFTGAVEGEPADTRRSGIGRREPAARRDETGRPATRGRSRETEQPRATEAVRGSRTGDALGGRGRAERPGRSSTTAGTTVAPAGGRGRRPVVDASVDGVAAGGRGRRPVVDASVDGVAAGGRGRRPVVDAPVDGAAALQVEVAAEPVRAESLRGVDAAGGPRLRVAPPAPISTPRAPFVAGVLALVIIGVLGILVINTKTNENSFRIEDLKKQTTELNNQKQDLENQLVLASSIGNLDAAARRLGMVKADKLALFRLPDGKVIGVPTPTDGTVAVTAQDAKTGTTDRGAANVVPVEGAQQQPAAGQGVPAATGSGPGTGLTAPGQGVSGQGATGLGVDGQGVTGQATTGQSVTGQATTGQTGNGQAGLSNGQTSGTGQ